MTPEGSLLCSQEPTTCPYHEPVKSSPRPPTLHPKIYSNILLHLPLGLLSGLPFRISNQNIALFLASTMCATYPANPSILDLITLIFGEATSSLLGPNTWCGYDVPGMVLLCDLKVAMRIDRSKDMSVYVSVCISYSSNTVTLVVWKMR